MIYLASPYSHPDPAVRERRYQQAIACTVALLREGHVVFSPIVHSVPLAAAGLPSDWQYWRDYDHEMIRRADALFVLALEGWRESIGVQEEVAFAAALRKPIGIIRAEPDGILFTLPCNTQTL